MKKMKPFKIVLNTEYKATYGDSGSREYQQLTNYITTTVSSYMFVNRIVG